MSMKKASYGDVRDRVLPGDVVAFLGDNPISKVIAESGTAGVSHVGLIVEAGSAALEPRFAESSVHVDDKKPTYGVAVSSFRAAHDAYAGAVWWLPLDATFRAALDQQRLAQFIADATGRLFDLPGGIGVVMKSLQQKILGAQLPQVRLELEKGYCCSALVANALVKAGVVNVGEPDDVNPSQVCSWRIYTPDYCLLKGDASISGYNSEMP